MPAPKVQVDRTPPTRPGGAGPRPVLDAGVVSNARAVLHELSNYLGVILNYTDLVLQYPDHPAEVAGDLLQIRLAARRAAALARELSAALPRPDAPPDLASRPGR